MTAARKGRGREEQVVKDVEIFSLESGWMVEAREDTGDRGSQVTCQLFDCSYSYVSLRQSRRPPPHGLIDLGWYVALPSW